jgi:hypothetical protein
VTFTTSLGRLEPAEARTTSGRVTVRLYGDGRSGTATITAFSGSATESIEVPVGAAAAARISVTANPQALPGVGGSTQVSARVEDQQGNGLAGIPVSFSTTRGSLSDTTVRSGADGIATTTLTTTQEATVTASAGGSTAALTGTVTVTIRPRTTIAITTTATSATVAVPVTFTVTPSANSVITNVTVDFGDGRIADLGTITGATTVSHPFRFQGVATVTARATDSDGAVGSSSIELAVAPLNVVLSANPSQPSTHTPVSFTATLPAGAIVDRFEWNFGDNTGTSTSSNQAVKSYPTVGTYVVAVRVQPLGGGTQSSHQIPLTVVP